MVSVIKTVFSFLAPVIEKIFGQKTEHALEIKAQKELEELRAFKAGRITPRFMLFYALVGLFVILAALIIASIFFPTIVNSPDTSRIRDLLEMGAGILP